MEEKEDYKLAQYIFNLVYGPELYLIIIVYILNSPPISRTFSENVSRSVILRGNHGTLSAEIFPRFFPRGLLV